MKLINQTTKEAVDLHDDLLWSDEHSWSKAVSTVTYAITGALIVQSGTRKAGRAITLVPPDEQMAWMPRATVDTLHAWADVADLVMTLQFGDGRTFNVQFRHADGALEVRPVKGFPSPEPDDPFLATIRFMEI